MSCEICRSYVVVREFLRRQGVVAVTDFPCPRGLPIQPESGASVDDFAPCDGCPHHVLVPPNRADACALMGGTPCALNARLRDGGPWPIGCRRAVATVPQLLPTTDSALKPEIAGPRGGCCGAARSGPSGDQGPPFAGAGGAAGARGPGLFGRSLVLRPVKWQT